MSDEIDFLVTQEPKMGLNCFKAVSERAKEVQGTMLMLSFQEWFVCDQFMDMEPEFIYQQVDNSQLL